MKHTMLQKVFNCIWMLLLAFVLLVGCGKDEGKKISVTMEIHCDTAIENGLLKEEKWQGVLPEDGCILQETTLEVTEGASAFDALMVARDQEKIQVEYSGAKGREYIKGIGNLYEFDGGRWSGWMFSVNGEYPNVGCGNYEVTEGDVIRFDYTCDLGLDLDANMNGAKEWKETHE